ncbi:DUF5131 family protein [Allomesorhizobium alhagi]|uniref:Gp37Gp68 family protein n=1 Tax=Mesorhizobium alhagi CCNWXJ12-2 TaxID=1107882 RepID=H0HNE9_9HYPH|nr:DUF5131 family protein [Mesorhizobium alhagi]EHK57721.1 hypothetical protein MAXJ12_08359 [Mesorhizobium alhagi CCNWXJ12-2]
MAENTAISWAKHTFNPWMGCTKVSPACDGCYAEALMDLRYGKVQWGPHGERVRTSVQNWNKVRRWQRQAAAAGEKWFIFCASLADIFDNQVPPEWRKDLFDLARECPNLIFLFLSKRPQNMVKMSEAAGGLPSNCALGTTCEDQKRWDINIPALSVAKYMLRPTFAFVSGEPLLGPMWVRRAPITPALRALFPAMKSDEFYDPLHPRQFEAIRIDWIITGGETDQGGHKARPWHPRWVRDIRDNCADAEVPFHHKQNGEWLPSSDVPEPWRFEGATVLPDGRVREWHPAYPGERLVHPEMRPMSRVGKKRSGRLIDGIEHNSFPKVTI